MTFSSNEELFNAVRELLSDLRIRGAEDAAEVLHEGFRCITGLTDGWAIFLEAIVEVQKNHSKQFSEDEKLLLKDLHDRIYQMAYGRKRKSWKFW